MKKNILVIALTLCLLLLCGCSIEEEAENTSTESAASEQSQVATESGSMLFEMEQLNDSSNISEDIEYYRDTTTDVMYVWKWSNNRGGLTEMSDPETGLPLTYMRYLELAESNT